MAARPCFVHAKNLQSEESQVSDHPNEEVRWGPRLRSPLSMRYWNIRFFLATMLVAGLSSSVSLLAQNATDKKATDVSLPAGQQTDPLKRPLSEKQQKENAKKLQHELGSNYKKWLNEDVRWIISGEEEQAFKQLSNDEE